MEDGQLHCPIAHECGGCALIDLDYAEQLRLKASRVREALGARPALSSVRVEDCLGAPERGFYRNRAKLAVGFQEGSLRIGLHGRGSNRIVDLAACSGPS
jgi:23S rRNA (uracil1939-C5)-methyltransferase